MTIQMRGWMQVSGRREVVTGPDKLISYEAAPGANVVISGAQVGNAWGPSSGFFRLPGPFAEANFEQRNMDPRQSN